MREVLFWGRYPFMNFRLKQKQSFELFFSMGKTVQKPVKMEKSKQWGLCFRGAKNNSKSACNVLQRIFYLQKKALATYFNLRVIKYLFLALCIIFKNVFEQTFFPTDFIQNDHLLSSLQLTKKQLTTLKLFSNLDRRKRKVPPVFAR